MNKLNKILCCRIKNKHLIFSRFSSSQNQNQTLALDDYIYTCNKRISHFIRCSQLDQARLLFDQMNYKNTVTWNSMITGYVRCRHMANARKLFDQMPARDVVSWNLMISGYCSISSHGGAGTKFVDEGRFLFDQIPDAIRDVVSWNTMISGYARIGRMDDAISLFHSMPHKNVVSWNAMLTGLLQNGDVSGAVEFYAIMPERDSASLSALLSGLIRNDTLDVAMKHLLEHDVTEFDSENNDLLRAYNTLIAGFAQRGRIDDARRLFDMIPSCSRHIGRKEGSEHKRFQRNIVSWNSMIMCYVKAGDIVSARSLFDQMDEKDTVSWNTIISGYANFSNMQEALNLFHAMPDPDTFSWNSMVSGFAQMGNIELARDFFDKTPQKNIVSWNSMISGYVKNEDFNGAIKLYTQMQVEGHKPDRHALSAVLAVCAEVVTLQLGMQIHQQVTKLVTADAHIKNSLVTMYSRCGAILEAMTIFEEVKMQKNAISWNAMIGGYASHGFAYEALELFNTMKQMKVEATYITFISVLNACASAGLVDEGKTHFKSMASEYGIEPGIQHYASLVDILGRHGEIEEAVKLIKSMPMEADKFVWGALLGACRVHNNAEYAREAAEGLMKVEPESSGAYVMLYNILVDAGRWEEANEVRVKMERKNIHKERARSRVGSE